MGEVRETKLRDDVQVRLPDGRVFVSDRGTPLSDFLRTAYPSGTNPPVVAIVEGKLRELAWPVDRDVEAIPVFLSDSDGIRIYSRSLSFLLVVVVAELFPKAHVYIDYSVPHGGYFCRVEGRKPFTSRELSRIKARMTAVSYTHLTLPTICSV